MGFLSWFQESPATDYESVLSRLATEVNDAKVHLSEIRLRERRLSFLTNLYGLALWALWVGLWWVRGIPFGLIGWDYERLEAKALGAGGILAGPIFIWGLHRIVRFYYSRQRNFEETHLRKLLAEQKKQVDAIKKATNYDSTRKLIEQYDLQNGGGGGGGGLGQMGTPGSAPSTPQRSQPGTPSPAGRTGSGSRPGPGPGAVQPGTPRAPGHLLGAGGTPMQPAPGTPIPAGMTPEQVAMIQMQQQQAIHPVLPTPEKRWYDRVVDSVLGEDPSQATQSKFALVCGECFRHNGLVGSKYEWERMQWICPRCNHMNPPPLSRQSGSGPSASSQPTPSLIPQGLSTPAQLTRQAASPRPRRGPAAESATPRSSRLRQQVFSAAESPEKQGEDVGEGEDGGGMDVDDK